MDRLVMPARSYRCAPDRFVVCAGLLLSLAAPDRCQLLRRTAVILPVHVVRLQVHPAGNVVRLQVHPVHVLKAAGPSCLAMLCECRSTLPGHDVRLCW